MHKLKHIRYIDYVIIIFIILSLPVITQGSSLNQIENPIGNSGSLNNNHIVLSMDFEDNWISNSLSTYAAPDNWVIQGICKGFRENNIQLTHYWSQINRDFFYTHTFWESSFVKDPFVYSGNYAASIWGNDGYMESELQGDRSDEWLITPELDFSSYYNITLSFWSTYVPTQWYTLPFPILISVDNQYLIKTSVDNGESWKKIADLRDASYKFGVNYVNDVYNNFDQQIHINLDSLSGRDNVRLAWHYLYDGNATSDLWILDDIIIRADYDSFAPHIEIVKPVKDNLYFLDAKVIPMIGKTIAIGPVDIIVDPTDKGTGTAFVEFYKNDKLQYTDSEYPFSWNWNNPGFGSSTIRTVAYDYAGNSNEDHINIFKVL
jgi:hypothetical protein